MKEETKIRATDIVVASRNPYKISEIRELLREAPFRVLSLDAYPDAPLVIEDRATLEGNAVKKATEIHAHTGRPTIADDTGLEVAALGGRPGVYSARFAGDEADDPANRALLLEELRPYPNRTARFKTIAAFVDGDDVVVFEGVCEGVIAENERGENGFGYDAIFVPDGSTLTFGEMSMEEKNVFSHRSKALEKLAVHLGRHFNADIQPGGHS